jgi:lysophospholipase L1-like esterase
MAAAGDSITLAYNAAGYASYPQYSWSTGTASTLNSLLQRLQVASGTTITGVNVAALGAKSSDLAGQVSSAIAAQADYLTVEIGANDACTPTVGAMTSVADYQARIQAALTAFHNTKADNRIFVASIPSLYQMWSISKDKFAARLVWSSAGICQSMLARPTSTSEADVNRRLEVQARVSAYNVALQTECKKLARCTFDDNAVAKYVFTSTHISTADYFHPSIEGQRVLATVTWAYNRYPTTG